MHVAVSPAPVVFKSFPPNTTHLPYGVSSISKSAAFYRDVLGLELSSQSEDIAFLSASGLTLMLSSELGKAFSPIAGATEIVFSVASVTAAFDLLTRRGCKFLNQPREVTSGSWAATFTDPDEHKLTVFGPR